MISSERARARFEELAAGPDEALGLLEGALLIAAEEQGRLDEEAVRGSLNALAAAAAAAAPASAGPPERASLLTRYLREDAGFRGNEADYYDPANSYLDQVLARRTGIPLTLSVVWIEVAARIGLPLEGVGFPGHFLVRAPSADGLLVDPFAGRIVDAAWCRDRLRAVLGPKAEVEAAHLRTATPRQMLVRMLGNLKQIHGHREEPERALACSERILLLMPDAPLEIRDRGLLLEALECYGPAVADFERFLALCPGDESADGIREHLAALRGRVPRLH